MVQPIESYLVNLLGVVGAVFFGPDLGSVFPRAFPETVGMMGKCLGGGSR